MFCGCMTAHRRESISDTAQLCMWISRYERGRLPEQDATTWRLRENSAGAVHGERLSTRGAGQVDRDAECSWVSGRRLGPETRGGEGTTAGEGGPEGPDPRSSRGASRGGGSWRRNGARPAARE